MNGTDTVICSNGNLDFKADDNYQEVLGTMSVKTGRWYWEAKPTSVPTNAAPQNFGITRGTAKGENSYVGYDGNGNGYGYSYDHNGNVVGDGSGNGVITGGVITTGEPTFTQNDIIGVAVDIPNGYLIFYKNGSHLYTISGINSHDWFPAFSSYNSGTFNVNFGQRPFSYTPPAGYKSLCAKNLAPSVPSIIRPQKHFDIILYTGQNTSSLYNVTGLEFAPDFVWAKSRNDTIGHIIIDTVRGDDKQLEANLTAVEVVRGTPSYRFLKDGFAVSTGGNMNNPVNYVAWCWKAGGAAVSNTDGTITSQVSANTEAGFSIMTWTGTGYVSGKTIGHGLGKAPKVIWAKRRNISTDNWAIYFNDGTTKVSWFFNTSAAINPAQASYWPANDPTSSVFYIGTDSAVNGSVNMNYVGYAWAEIPGYSKFGIYKGNGNAAGTIVDVGFKPAWVMIKDVSGTDSWLIMDNKRDIDNPVGNTLAANTSNTENADTGGIPTDFLSNGFKCRGSGGDYNGSGETYFYMAFAEQPGITAFDTFANAR